MSPARGAARAEARALLAMRAELDRTRVTLAVYEIRRILAPGGDAGRIAGNRPLAAILVRLAGPLVGLSRLGRWLRFASLALFAVRVAREWRRPH